MLFARLVEFEQPEKRGKRDKCLVRYGTGNARLDLVMFAYSIVQ